MLPKWWRLGIRPQLTIIVVLAAVLSTVATLIIADNAINNYVLQQANNQERDNMKIAFLVLQTQYGQNISISSKTDQCPSGCLVVDVPGGGKDVNISADNNYGRYALNDNIDYVDQVQQLIGGSVSVYQCSDTVGNTIPGCNRVATTFNKVTSSGSMLQQRETGVALSQSALNNVGVYSNKPHEWLGEDTIDNRAYYADYSPIFNPQGQVIGVIFVGVPLDIVTTVVSSTTIELILIGAIIMVAALILALFSANAIVNTLQRAARQVSAASERIGGIATQQANGSAQQVWAINAINQALQNFSETAKDISQRTDQLSQMGNQVLQRRGEISPTQIDSILAFMTRSVRDISVASRQQAAQYERMTGAMQAVIEIAEQVAGNAQQSNESAERMELVVRQLRQLVGVRLGRRRNDTSQFFGSDSTNDLATVSDRGAMLPSAQGSQAAVAGAPNMNAGRNGQVSVQHGQIPAGQMMNARADGGGVGPSAGAPSGGGQMQRDNAMGMAPEASGRSGQMGQMGQMGGITGANGMGQYGMGQMNANNERSMRQQPPMQPPAQPGFNPQPWGIDQAPMGAMNLDESPFLARLNAERSNPNNGQRNDQGWGGPSGPNSGPGAGNWARGRDGR